jgi:hypothetical protein
MKYWGYRCAPLSAGVSGGFVASPFWKQAKGQFSAPLEVANLPTSLLERFTGEDIQTRLLQLLRFLLPLTTSERVV